MAEHSGPYLEFQYLEGGGGRITNSRGAWIKVRPWTEEQGEWGRKTLGISLHLPTNIHPHPDTHAHRMHVQT